MVKRTKARRSFKKSGQRKYNYIYIVILLIIFLLCLFYLFNYQKYKDSLSKKLYQIFDTETLIKEDKENFKEKEIEKYNLKDRQYLEDIIKKNKKH